jgi:hypothetical protein
MADVSPSEPKPPRSEPQAEREPQPPREPQLSLAGTWKRLNFEQRAAAVGASLLIVSTLGPFSFVEAAIILIGAAVLLLLRKRAEGKLFHVPFGDGAVIAAAGAWAGLLIVIRLFDRPLGQGLLALVCAAILFLAGIRERVVRPMDDLPEGHADPGTPPAPPPDPEERARPAADRPAPPSRPSPPGQQETAETQALPARVLPPATPPAQREQPPLWDEPTD